MKECGRPAYAFQSSFSAEIEPERPQNTNITYSAYLEMLEWFTETTGRQRLIYGLIGIGGCLVLLFAFGLIWFWLWAVSAVLLLSSGFGEWR